MHEYGESKKCGQLLVVSSPTPQNKMNGRGEGGAQAKFYADVAFSIPEIPIGHSCDRSQQLAVCAKVADSRKTDAIVA